MPAAAPSDDLVAERYGRVRRTGRTWWWVAGVGIVVGVAWAAWVASAQTRDPVVGQVYGFDVTSATSTDVELQVDRTEGQPAVCEVYAVALDHSIVGERTVRIPAGDPGTIRVSAQVRTERRAVTGDLRSCAPTG